MDNSFWETTVVQFLKGFVEGTERNNTFVYDVERGNSGGDAGCSEHSLNL